MSKKLFHGVPRCQNYNMLRTCNASRITFGAQSCLAPRQLFQPRTSREFESRCSGKPIHSHRQQLTTYGRVSSCQKPRCALVLRLQRQPPRWVRWFAPRMAAKVRPPAPPGRAAKVLARHAGQTSDHPHAIYRTQRNPEGGTVYGLMPNRRTDTVHCRRGVHDWRERRLALRWIPIPKLIDSD